MKEYQPLLMIDDTTKDGHAETIMDYIISWCIRCTNYQYVKEKQPTLYQYCKYMLCVLLNKIDQIKDIMVDDVHVWKQEERTDLWAEVVLYVKDKTEPKYNKEKHALLIENKYYTLTRDGQLAKYRQTFEEYYKDNMEFPEDNLHRALVTCLYSTSSYYVSLKQDADANKFDLFNLYELVDKSMNYAPSESDIFNQLFIEEWI